MTTTVVKALGTREPWRYALFRLLRLLMVALAITAFLFRHEIETALHPVIIDGEWGEFVRAERDGIVVSASGQKVRECGWVKTEFFLGARGYLSSYMKDARHLDEPMVRDQGVHYWSEIFLPISRSAFEDGFVYADSIHDCGGRLVRSHFLN